MKALYFFVLLVSSTLAPAATYYVDLTGNDANRGTSASSPWRTVARVNRASLKPGDLVLFAGGQVWREELMIRTSGMSGSPITFAAYGNDSDAPIISGANRLTFWTKAGGSVWQASCPTAPKVVAFDGMVGPAKDSTASLAAPGDWFWSTATLSVYSSTNPAQAWYGAGVEAGARDYCIRSMGSSYINYSYLSLQFANLSCFRAFGNDNNLAFTDVAVLGPGDRFGYEFESSNGLILTRCRADYNRGANSGDGFMFKGSCGNVTMRDCKASYNFRRGVQFDTGVSGYIRIHGGEFHHQHGETQSDGLAIDANDNILIEGVWSHDNAPLSSNDGIQISGNSRNPVVRYCLLENNSNAGLVLEADGGEIVCNISRNNRHGFANCGNAALTRRYLNNTAYNNEYGMFFYQISPVGQVVIKNNIFYATNSLQRCLMMRELTLDDTAVKPNSNCYWSDSESNLIEWKGRVYNRSQFSQFQSDTGKDSYSIIKDPMFVCAASGDLHLLENSPCRNKGASMGLVRDWAGVIMSTRVSPDLGALQYIVTPKKTTSALNDWISYY